MSGQGAKLAVAFTVSLVLHAAGLWAVAARIEPRQAKPQGEVEIVDRELFFRHAPLRQVERTGPVSASQRLRARHTVAAEPARAAVEAIAPAAADAARRHMPEQHLASTNDAETARPVTKDLVRPVQQAPERIAPDAELDNAAAVEAQASLVAAKPEERLASAQPEIAAGRQIQPRDTLAAAAPEDRLASAQPRAAEARQRRPRDTLAAAHSRPRLTRAEAAADAQPVDASTSLAAAEPDDRLDSTPRTPEAVQRAPVLPRAPVLDVEEVVGPVRDDVPPARPAAPLAVLAEAPQPPSRAPAVAPRPAPEVPSAEVAVSSAGEMVVARTTADASATRTTEPDLAERATAGLVLTPRGAEPEQPQAFAATPLAPSSSQQPAPAVAPQAPVSRPAATLEPATDAAAPHVSPRTPERLAALAPGQVVDSDPAATVAPATEAARLSPDPAPDTAGHAERVRPSSAPAVSPSGAAVRLGAVPDAQPVAPASPQSDAPVAVARRTITPVPAAPEAAAPAARAPQRLAAIDPADRFTRSYKGGECFLALREASAENAEIVSYAVRLQSVLAFKAALAQELDIEPQVGWEAITDSQCSGISFARVVLGNSAPSLTIQLDHNEIVSGGSLSGRLPDDALAHITVLLVDDDGLVHNLSDFLRRGPDGIELFIPQLHAIRDGKRKVHLLMAISASTALPALESDEAIHSDDFFAQLLQQVRDSGANVELGLDHFVVF